MCWCCEATDIHGLPFLLRPGAEYEQIEGDGSHDVDEEPALEVVLCDAPRVANHLVVVVNVGGPEVDEDVHDEHDIHHQVHHIERVASVATGSPPLFLHLIEKEGGRVRRENGGVDDQKQDDPVPYCFEGAIVKDGPFVDARGLELVLWQHVSTKGQHLKREGHDGSINPHYSELEEQKGLSRSKCFF